LPFLVNGTLSPAEQRAMHLFFSENPELLEDLRWHQGMLLYAQKHGAALSAVENTSSIPQTGLLMRQFQTVLQAWKNFAAGGPSLAHGALVFVSGVLVSVLAMHMPWEGAQQEQTEVAFAEHRGMGQTRTIGKACFRVLFKQDASMEHVNQLLSTHFLSIFEGPNGVSEYTLTTGRMNQTEAVEALKSSDVVKEWAQVHTHDVISCTPETKK
jgi:hypothetical protein